VNPPPVVKPPPPKPKPVPTGETPTDQTFTLADLTYHEAKLDAKAGVRCLAWDSAGKSFYFLESSGLLRRLSVPSFQEEARLDAGFACSWVSPSREGLLLTIPEKNEVWILNPDTLEVKNKLTLTGVTRMVSAPNLSVGFAFAGADIVLVVDLQKRTAGKKFLAQTLGRPGSFGTPVVTPDGRYLFTASGLGELIRIKIDGSRVLAEQATPALGGNAPGIEVSNDYVALPCGAGNSKGLPNHPNISGYSTYVYAVSDLTRPVAVVAAGAYPRALAFDAASGTIYAQNADNQLMLFTLTGEKEKEYSLGGGDVKQILVHPKGRKAVILTHEALFFVELPEK
jgi:hypothetical protein